MKKIFGLVFILLLCAYHSKAQSKVEFSRGVNYNYFSYTKLNSGNPDLYRRSYTGILYMLKGYLQIKPRSLVSVSMDIRGYGWGFAIRSPWQGAGVGLKSPYFNTTDYSVAIGAGYSYAIYQSKRKKYSIYADLSINLNKLLENDHLYDTSDYNQSERRYSYPQYLQYDVPYQNLKLLPQLNLALNQNIAIWKQLYLKLGIMTCFGFDTVIKDYMEVQQYRNGDKYRYELEFKGNSLLFDIGLGIRAK